MVEKKEQDLAECRLNADHILDGLRTFIPKIPAVKAATPIPSVAMETLLVRQNTSAQTYSKPVYLSRDLLQLRSD